MKVQRFEHAAERETLKDSASADAASVNAGSGRPGDAKATLDVLERALEGSTTARHRYHYLLFLRFTIINGAGFALLGAAYFQGWIGLVIAGDHTGIVFLIAGLFGLGLGLCAWKIWRTSRELNQIKDHDPLRPSRIGTYLDAVRKRHGDSRSILADTLKLKMANRISVVRYIANTLVLVGLIGTVLGFIIALSGVEPTLASDVASVGPMVSTLIKGMSVALYTTLVGAVLNIWLMTNYRILLSGTVNLITAIIELGERNARA